MITPATSVGGIVTVSLDAQWVDEPHLGHVRFILNEKICSSEPTDSEVKEMPRESGIVPGLILSLISEERAQYDCC